MFGGMPDSPKGREIKTVEGSPSGIIARGTAIEELGKKMDAASDTLQAIKENTFAGGEQQGKAIEKLQETIGDSYKVLEEAAELYKPVGPVIVKYGEMLETYKPIIDRSASTCSDLWDTYDALPGDKDDSMTEDDGGILGIGDTDKEEAAENKAKKAAYDNWEDEAERFDTWYDVWEDGFDEAVNGISDGLSGAIEDSTWDNIGDFINAAYEVLTWAALIIAVVAIFCTGLGALAAILALLAFGLSCIKFAYGQQSLGQLGLDALGIIPVTKLSNLSKLGHLLNIGARQGSDVGKAGSKVWGAMAKGPLGDLTNAARAKDVLGIRSGSEMLEQLIGKNAKNFRTDNLRMYIGNYDALKAGLGEFRGLTKVEFRMQQIGAGLGTIGNAGKLTQGTDHFDPIPIDIPEVKIPGMPAWVSF